MKKIQADQGTGEWLQVFNMLAPISSQHPPSLKNPQKLKIPTAQDGWRKTDSKKDKAQARKDLVEIHKRLRRQFGKPEITQGANYPLFPNIAQNT